MGRPGEVEAENHRNAKHAMGGVAAAMERS